MGEITRIGFSDDGFREVCGRAFRRSKGWIFDRCFRSILLDIQSGGLECLVSIGNQLDPDGRH